ncbi:hypothetical protein [Xanthomonas theicola]|uniref:hypothetical protein n=1 Tax=Xanthomonas theicola TaxID=56464 RepID=UPI001304ED66|nr:hypothetical protein G4Q83_06495 [Xanthomonas theicola]
MQARLATGRDRPVKMPAPLTLPSSTRHERSSAVFVQRRLRSDSEPNGFAPSRATDFIGAACRDRGRFHNTSRNSRTDACASGLRTDVARHLPG